MKDIERVPVLSLAQGWSVHYRMEREFLITQSQPVQIELFSLHKHNK